MEKEIAKNRYSVALHRQLRFTHRFCFFRFSFVAQFQCFLLLVAALEKNRAKLHSLITDAYICFVRAIYRVYVSRDTNIQTMVDHCFLFLAIKALKNRRSKIIKKMRTHSSRQQPPSEHVTHKKKQLFRIKYTNRPDETRDSADRDRIKMEMDGECEKNEVQRHGTWRRTQGVRETERERRKWIDRTKFSEH